MARRSVVLDSPPGAAPRATEVVRVGPPAGEKRRLDVVLGVLGVALVVAAVVLVQALPERDIIFPQYRVTALDGVGEFGTQRFNLTEMQAQQEVEYEVPDDVYAILVVVEFQDDNAASLRDAFQVELIDPLGVLVGTRGILESGRPSPSESQTLAYNATVNQGRYSFSIAPRPEEAIVPGLREDETAREVQARLQAEAHTETAGTWTVRITLLEAGDCPPPEDPDAVRVLSCTLQAPDGDDTGNPVSVALFRYTTFQIQVEEPT